MDRLRLGVAAVLLAVLCPSRVSVGEPLEKFGKVEVRGKPKAPATDSQRKKTR